MKKLIIVCSLIILFLPSSSFAQDYRQEYLEAGYDWILDNFLVNFTINNDATVDVQEVIKADFLTEKHGIYRYIPTKYRDSLGLNYDLYINLISLTDENGQSWNIAESRKRNPFYLKIGDADVTISGLQTYIINYKVDQSIRYFDDHDEFYWNVTGFDWDTDILSAKSRVVLPREFKPDEIKLNCYSGAFGSQEQKCNYSFVDNQTIEFVTTDLQRAGQDDFTIVVWMPKGMVYQPAGWDLVWLFVKNNWGFGIFVPIFLLMYLIWQKKGKDPKFDKTIIVQYTENAELSPIVADILLRDGDVGNKSISAEIVYLASHGYLKIQEILKEKSNKVKDYEFIQMKKPDDKLKKFQKILLQRIFSHGEDGKVVIGEDLVDTFYQDITKIKSEVRIYINKYYSTSPTWKFVFLIIGGLLMVPVFYAGYDLGRMDILIGLILSIIIVVGFGWFMAKKTSAGQEMAWQAAGLEQFIEVTDKDRAKFYEDKNIFEKALPYAMVFGLAKKWGKAFEGIYTKQPDWYSGASIATFNAASFADSIDSFAGSSSVGLGSVSGSGMSGGSSGGGGGGGW